MLLLLPTVAAKLLALHELATRSDADSERTWVEVRGRLDAEVAACRWPAPRLLADGDAMRLAIEYVAELDPAALRTACDEGPTPAEDWRDALAEVLATAMHLRRVAEQESLPTMGAYRESERRAAGKRAEERRRELARWKSY